MTKSLSQIINERYHLWMAHHMTHVENLPTLLETGELRSYNLMRDQCYRSLANDDVQAGRAGITVPITQRPLHDYVPLYLGFKTPMLAVNKDHNEDILYLRFSLDLLQTPGSVICDGNARSSSSKFYLFTEPDDFAHLDIAAIRTVKYAGDPEKKRKKQAEILIPDRLPIAQVFDIICYSEKAKSRILSSLQQFGIAKAVKSNMGWYFTS